LTSAAQSLRLPHPSASRAIPSRALPAAAVPRTTPPRRLLPTPRPSVASRAPAEAPPPPSATSLPESLPPPSRTAVRPASRPLAHRSLLSAHPASRAHLLPNAAGLLQVRFGCPARDCSHARHQRRALRRRNHPSCVQQVEQVRALQAL